LADLSEAVPTGRVEGLVRPGYEGLADAFLANFRERGEVGAGLCLIKDGETVVDLWGGSADPKADTPWTEDTISVVFSCTKGALALVAHMLVDEGLLDLDRPVTEYWTSYAGRESGGAGGKERTSVRMLLDHTAGLPAFREPVKDGGFLDWDYMVDRIECEATFFEPGTQSSYHGLTYAWTVGEVIRRVAGKPASQILRERVTGPLGLDFHIGLPESEEGRLARILKPKFDPTMTPTAFMSALADKTSIPALFFLNDGGFNPNKPEYRRAEIGSANGVGNARSLAGLYAGLSVGGSWRGVDLVSPERLADMATPSNEGQVDATLCLPMRFGPGFMKSVDNRRMDPPAAGAILSKAAFGHGGAGGSIGFADPEARFSFAYTMNQMGVHQLLNERGQSLVDAAYTALGYRSNESGCWVR